MNNSDKLKQESNNKCIEIINEPYNTKAITQRFCSAN